MLLKVDNLGRTVIPKKVRLQLNITDVVEAEVIGNEFVLSSPKRIRTREEIENKLESINQKNELDVVRKEVLEWVLNREEK